MKNRHILISLYLILLVSSPGAIELLDMTNIQVNLDLDFGQSLLYRITDSKVLLEAPAADLEMEVVNEKMSIDVSLELAQLFRNNPEGIIGNCLFSYAFSDTLFLKMGQMKNAFGQEYNKGRKARPYPGHSLSSEAISPGYSRGVMLSADRLFDIIGIDAGLFAGGAVTKNDNNLLKLLPAGNMSLQLPLGDVLALELSYSGLADLEMLPIFQYRLAQGISAQLDCNLGKKNDITLFAEFLEKYYNSLYLNGNPHWRHGLFTYASWQLAAWEPFASYEHYKADTAVPSTEDMMVICGGTNYYPLANLCLRAWYRWDYAYLAATSSHMAGIMLAYRM